MSSPVHTPLGSTAGTVTAQSDWCIFNLCCTGVQTLAPAVSAGGSVEGQAATFCFFRATRHEDMFELLHRFPQLQHTAPVQQLLLLHSINMCYQLQGIAKYMIG